MIGGLGIAGVTAGGKRLRPKVTIPAAASELFANRPTGLAAVVDNDGSVAESGGNAFGSQVFSSWWTVPGGSVDTVADPDNPSGSGTAIRFNWEALGGGAGHAGQAWMANDEVTGLGGPFDTLYVSFSIKYISGAAWDGTGPKIFYFGDDGTDHWIEREAPNGEVRVIPQGQSDVLTTVTGLVPLDEWHVIEMLLIAESTPGSSGDGEVYVWVDGANETHETAISWNGTPGWNYIQWYAHGDSGINSNSEYRVGHFYVGGKN